MSLKNKIFELIETNGPISVSQYMAYCLYDSEYGYYRRSKPIGAEGDFVTAPEISQLFGECIAVFIVTHWLNCGRAKKINLIEFGPGRGTLMRDAVRVLETSKDFEAEISIHFIESNSHLIDIQKARLSNYRINYCADVTQVPKSKEIPNYLIANEFFDCLPINQYCFHDGKWREKLIGVKDDELVFGLFGEYDFAIDPGFDGAILEIVPSLQALTNELCDLVKTSNGAAVIIDYGYLTSGFENTFQAIKRHQKCNIFETPGDTDLTAHVNFGAIKNFAEESGVFTQGPMNQSEFLQSLGINERASQLMKFHPERTDEIKSGLNRLIGKDQMGELFKTILLHL